MACSSAHCPRSGIVLRVDEQAAHSGCADVSIPGLSREIPAITRKMLAAKSAMTLEAQQKSMS